MSFHHRPMSTVLLSISLAKSLTACVVFVAFVGGLGIEASAEGLGPVPVKPCALASTSKGSHVIVVGFMGGFVRPDDQHHPEVRLIRELRQEYPTKAFLGLFENSRVDEAYQMILRELDIIRHAEPACENETRNARILLFGHSWGGSAMVRFARKLGRAGIPVALTVQMDSVAKPFTNDAVIPSNVSEAVNFYQVHGLIRGRSRIMAADVERTTIIGNFRRDYRTEPKECRNFPWYSRFFTKGHIEIECDPNLWSEVKLLLERNTPSDELTAGQLQPLGSDKPSPFVELGEMDRLQQSKPIRRN